MTKLNEKKFKDWNEIPKKDAKYMCSHRGCCQKPTHYVEKDEYYLVLCDEHFAEWSCKGATPEALLQDFDKDENGIPIVYGTPRKDYPQGLEFFCIFCGKVHKHGGAGYTNADSCTNDSSPFKKTGYFLRQKCRTQKLLTDFINQQGIMNIPSEAIYETMELESPANNMQGL